MTEQEIKDLGFEKVFVPTSESGDTTDYYYYQLTINGTVLSSCADDDVKNEDWHITIDLFENTRIFDALEVNVLIKMLDKWQRNLSNG